LAVEYVTGTGLIQKGGDPMKRAVVLILGIMFLSVVSGCSGEKIKEKPAAVNSTQQTQSQITSTESEKPKPSEPIFTPQKSTKEYLPTKARSKQKVVATFRVNSQNCIIDGKPMTMEAPLRTQYERFIAVPARSFALAIGIPNGEYQLSKKNKFDLVSMTHDNITVTGANNFITIQDKSFYRLDKMAYVDSAGIPYISMNAFAKAFGYDMYWDEDTGIVELLQGLPNLEENDLVIASLQPRVMTGNQIISVLGKPDKIDWHHVGGYGHLVYTDFIIYTQGPKDNPGDSDVLSITTTSPKYKTKRGIAVGDNIAKVIELYGMGYQFNKERNVYYYFFLVRYVDQEKFIGFKVEGDRVISIEVGDYAVP
jgi:hypothetical protein